MRSSSALQPWAEILANDSRPAEFLYDNLAIAGNIIHAAAELKVEKLMFLGAACIYPRLAPQPISENSLLQGAPEPTNEWYTIAKIAGVKLCQAHRKQYGCDFISAVPANLYGPGDHFDALTSHVIPSLLMRADEAKKARATELSIWGTGSPIREFMYVDDCAEALVFLMKTYSDAQPINIGTGEEISIGNLAREICAVVGFSGQLSFDHTKPTARHAKRLSFVADSKNGLAIENRVARGPRENLSLVFAARSRVAFIRLLACVRSGTVSTVPD